MDKKDMILLKKLVSNNNGFICYVEFAKRDIGMSNYALKLAEKWYIKKYVIGVKK